MSEGGLVRLLLAAWYEVCDEWMGSEIGWGYEFLGNGKWEMGRWGMERGELGAESDFGNFDELCEVREGWSAAAECHCLQCLQCL